MNPLALIGEILIAAVIVGVIYMIYKLIIQKKVGPGFGQTNAKYRKAAQQSKRKYSDPSNQLTKVRGLSQKTPIIKKSIRSNQPSKRRRDHNLTVIEGKKNKKKNRAFF